jgi:C1A family cysteine protease
VGASAYLEDSQYEFLFAKWVGQHGKNYGTEGEMSERYRVFQSNLNTVMKHNAGNHTYTMAMNKFGDISWNEFRTTYMGFNNNQQRPYARSLNAHVGVQEVAADIDWSTSGAVTAVKDQGQCGSCWAFSSTGGFEGAYFIAKGELINFSEQQLVDCAGSFGNQGCNGGLMDNAFEYWMSDNGANGPCKQTDYPYTARDGSCKKTCSPVATPSGYTDVPSGSESSLGSALTRGPVSIAIQADQSGFQFYNGGVFDGTCGTSLDHGVLLVGSGSDAGKSYWKVKNSWGAGWGESGYIRLVQGQNQCGLTLAASYPQA